VPAMHTYDYAVVRVVPRVERGEFVNVGVIVSCDATDSLAARIELDPERVLALDPNADIDAIRAALGAIDAVCAGSVGAGSLAKLSARERFHWLVAPRSSSVQTSAVHTGRCDDPELVIEKLMGAMVRRPPRTGDQPTAPG